MSLDYFRSPDQTIFFDKNAVPEVGDGFGFYGHNSSIHELLVDKVTTESGHESYTVVVSGDPDYPGKTAVMKRNGEFINYRGANYRLKRF